MRADRISRLQAGMAGVVCESARIGVVFRSGIRSGILAGRSGVLADLREGFRSGLISSDPT
jgi:hypothetical protein